MFPRQTREDTSLERPVSGTAWQERGVLIVAPAEDPMPGAALASLLADQGVPVRVVHPEAAAERQPAMDAAGVIGLLPRQAAAGDDGTKLRRTIARLLAIAAAAAPGTKRVAIVQFAGGDSGRPVHRRNWSALPPPLSPVVCTWNIQNCGCACSILPRRCPCR